MTMTISPPPQLPQKQRGLALIMVLTMLTVLITLAANYILTVSRDTESIDWLNSRTQARYSALSGIQYGLFAMQDNDSEIRWKTDGRLYHIELAGGQVYTRIIPESGRVDINVAHPDLLALLFQYAGADEETAIQLVENTVHWRNQEDIPVGQSVTDRDYEDAGLPLPSHRRFYSIEELSQVYGVTPQMYQQIKSLITVYGNNRINGLVMPDTMFAVLQLNEEQIEAIRAARETYYLDEGPISAEVRGITPLISYETRSAYYRVMAYAITPNGQTEAVYSIIKNQRDRSGTYREMYRETISGEDRKAFIEAVNTAQQNEEG